VWSCYIEIALVLYWPVFVQYNLLSAHKTISSKARIPILHGRGTTARDNCTSSKRMRVRACIGRPAFGSMETRVFSLLPTNRTRRRVVGEGSRSTGEEKRSIGDCRITDKGGEQEH
jgi:hypothetical protein